MKKERILIVKPSSMGDIIHVFPALAFLQEKLPNASFDFVVHPAFAGILDYAPVPIRRRILFQRRKLGQVTTFPLALFQLCRELRRRRYDLVIDFQGLLRSGFCAAVTRHSRVVGFAEPREHMTRVFYDAKIPVPGELHAVERNLRLAAAAIGVEAPADPPRPSSSPLVRYDEKPLPEDVKPPYIVMLPGARWHSKCFPPQLFARIAGAVGKEHPELGFLLIGSSADHPRAETIMGHLPKQLRVKDLTGRTTERELVELLHGASAVVCNDTGPMHIAAMLGRPLFAFFGATDPKRTGPWSADAHIYTQPGLSCLGCLRRHCPKQTDGYPACQRLDPLPIAAEINRLLDAAAPGASPRTLTTKQPTSGGQPS